MDWICSVFWVFSRRWRVLKVPAHRQRGHLAENLANHRGDIKKRRTAPVLPILPFCLQGTIGSKTLCALRSSSASMFRLLQAEAHHNPGPSSFGKPSNTSATSGRHGFRWLAVRTPERLLASPPRLAANERASHPASWSAHCVWVMSWSWWRLWPSGNPSGEARLQQTKARSRQHDD